MLKVLWLYPTSDATGHALHVQEQEDGLEAHLLWHKVHLVEGQEGLDVHQLVEEGDQLEGLEVLAAKALEQHQEVAGTAMVLESSTSYRNLRVKRLPGD